MDSDYSLPVKEVVASVENYCVNIGDQDYMWKPSPQCPKHWFVLETNRGPEPYTLRISPCSRCVEETEIKEKSNV